MKEPSLCVLPLVLFSKENHCAPVRPNGLFLYGFPSCCGSAGIFVKTAEQLKF
jgi:hypothetical protein